MADKEATNVKDGSKDGGDVTSADKGEDTAALMRQLLSALEKYGNGKPGEPSKGKKHLRTLV